MAKIKFKVLVGMDGDKGVYGNYAIEETKEIKGLKKSFELNQDYFNVTIEKMNKVIQDLFARNLELTGADKFIQIKAKKSPKKTAKK
jgi:hypothetical protein